VSTAVAVAVAATANPWIAAARAAAVDVLTQALSLPCAISDQHPPRVTMGALIPFVGDMSPVQIGLFSDEAGCQRIARALLYAGPDDPLSKSEMVDAISEIVNILSGTIKGRVARYATHAALGLPAFVMGPIEPTSGQVIDTVNLSVDGAVAQVVIVRALNDG
jgi:CheY-specific phosphatase CheX